MADARAAHTPRAEPHRGARMVMKRGHRTSSGRSTSAVAARRRHARKFAGPQDTRCCTRRHTCVLVTIVLPLQWPQQTQAPLHRRMQHLQMTAAPERNCLAGARSLARWSARDRPRGRASGQSRRQRRGAHLHRSTASQRTSPVATHARSRGACPRALPRARRSCASVPPLRMQPEV